MMIFTQRQKYFKAIDFCCPDGKTWNLFRQQICQMSRVQTDIPQDKLSFL
jgi:hypothetical protein